MVPHIVILTETEEQARKIQSIVEDILGEDEALLEGLRLWSLFIFYKLKFPDDYTYYTVVYRIHNRLPTALYDIVTDLLKEEFNISEYYTVMYVYKDDRDREYCLTEIKPDKNSKITLIRHDERLYDEFRSFCLGYHEGIRLTNDYYVRVIESIIGKLDESIGYLKYRFGLDKIRNRQGHFTY